ncbi:uncharacterized protein BDV17DRAFT_298587 [Aspergillus undulatus]|uniref:uncharacterized protein n=1 Tax=Aspergillus undulatus TaxID=1810928 RepID=UPI003CCD5F37
MAPTIFIAGAAGNTGVGVTKTLSNLFQTCTALSNHRILALTPSLNSPAAQQLAQLPGVEHEVVRAFIACYVNPLQFVEESTFLLAALKAEVKYVVRISTAAPNVHPDCPAYYPRSHWALEALLSSPEFSGLQWTSLQPNGFAPTYLYSAAEFIRHYRKTGKQDTILRLMASEDVPVGSIDPAEVGVFAAYLLAQEDTASHNKPKYVLNGPEDITGRQIVTLVEQYIGASVENVSFKDMSFVDSMVAASGDHGVFVSSVRHALEVAWEGKCTASTTSKEVLEIAAPKRTAIEVLRELVGEE